MSGWTNEKTNEALKTVFAKAATDKAFRALVLENPNEAVKQAAGVEIPAGFTVRFVENDGVDATFVLPDFIGDSELSDEQLEAVAGGKKKKKDDDDDFDKGGGSSPSYSRSGSLKQFHGVCVD
ncbi:NHLP leader peptide family natural product precursor [Paenibacillus hemerocallicola]|uniref:NHLP leader peptide family natural product n=1 Tax=Paenibacillus hemerocallicola TaxID=1172614 RepID=A0A5C4T766_9BACL|nr:NHLP leader peptide family RiPP precursor [Paenibacillus hemerocallicola]TNJ64944.1 NHLP leader peptide family natural product precursor [Paenibacillus hemerocallicola]